MSPKVETAFPAQAQALFAGFQELYQHPATLKDVRRYPSVGRNAYNEEEVRWFEATHEFLEGRLDDAERAKRMLPAKKYRRAGRSAASASAAAPVPSPAAWRRHGSGGGGTDVNCEGRTRELHRGRRRVCFRDTQFQEERTQSQVDSFVYHLSFFWSYFTYCAYF